jgi:phosphate starvation-inducible PhoH-like protein
MSKKRRIEVVPHVEEERTKIPDEITSPLQRLRRNKNYKFLPKNKSQQLFIDSIEQKNIVFNIGSAGSGKTYVAVAWAIEKLCNKNEKYRKLILTRPAVEACGEEIGFLPGSKEEKLEPYMQPIYDIFFKYGIRKNDVLKMIEEDIIEIMPLAFMRGRSIESSILIAEEAQNMNSQQMEMLLTRYGQGSKFIITGDITQRDIKKAVGIEEACELFKESKKIQFIFFGKDEILRDPIVAEIVDKYEELRERPN